MQRQQRRLATLDRRGTRQRGPCGRRSARSPAIADTYVHRDAPGCRRLCNAFSDHHRPVDAARVSERKPPMENAKHIGCMWALAVALGVGMAVANTPAVALAAPADSGKGSSSGESSPSSSSRHSGSTSSDTPSAKSALSATNDAPSRRSTSAESARRDGGEQFRRSTNQHNDRFIWVGSNDGCPHPIDLDLFDRAGGHARDTGTRAGGTDGGRCAATWWGYLPPRVGLHTGEDRPEPGRGQRGRRRPHGARQQSATSPAPSPLSQWRRSLQRLPHRLWRRPCPRPWS